MALHGGDAEEVADIDLLTSVRDARTLLRGQGGIAGEADAHFRSEVFGSRTLDDGWRVEITGGLAIVTDNSLIKVRPRTREPVMLDGPTLYVPARVELIAILRRFGRPKDLRRAAALADQPSG